MKIFLAWPLILLIFSSQVHATCVEDEITIEKKTYKVCKTGKYGFLSQECKKVTDCFPANKTVIDVIPTQNPAFTYCESIKGKAVVAQPKSLKTNESFCVLNEKIIDLNQLINAR